MVKIARSFWLTYLHCEQYSIINIYYILFEYILITFPSEVQVNYNLHYHNIRIFMKIHPRAWTFTHWVFHVLFSLVRTEHTPLSRYLNYAWAYKGRVPLKWNEKVKGRGKNFHLKCSFQISRYLPSISPLEHKYEKLLQLGRYRLESNIDIFPRNVQSRTTYELSICIEKFLLGSQPLVLILFYSSWFHSSRLLSVENVRFELPTLIIVDTFSPTLVERSKQLHVNSHRRRGQLGGISFFSFH